MTDLKSGSYAIASFHKETLKGIVLNKEMPDATMFSCATQGNFYWKYDSHGYLCHNFGFMGKTRNEWIQTQYKDISQAYRAGVVNIYDLVDLEKLLKQYGDI